ncbi:phage tail length tape measure family protein [Methyloceanibacter sp.]|uniref:phage tail length tape measure family protein n=1 Tax=Methyloceanibacter sp. TaxID=1965321 RepID=UPI002B7BE975|nr:phage tail length tape measure family protein [Methyloceanibacter sp.]HML92211.1 phage tail length tape measure family protein [Methyloceanibacter sp.]
MTMRLSLVISGDAKGATKAAKDTSRELGVLGDQAEAASVKLREIIAASAEHQKAVRELAGLSAAGIRGIGAAGGAAGEQLSTAQRKSTTFFGATAKGASLNTAQMQNLQFQLQDMAQGLLTGNQSPFTLIVQQGSQISQIFGPNGSVKAALAAVGGGISTFVTNPLNLTVLAIAAAAAAAQTFVRTGRDVEHQLESHEKLIERIAKKYREAAEGAQDYGRETLAALTFSAQQNVRDLEQALADASPRIDFVLPDQGTGQGPFASAIGRVGPFFDAIQKWNASIKEGVADARAFQAEILQIANSLPEHSPFTNVAKDLLSMTNDAKGIAAALDQARDAAKGLSGDADASARALGRLKTAAGILKDLQFEHEQLARSNVEQEVWNNLKRAGVEITSKMGQAIAEETRQLEAGRTAREDAQRLEKERIAAAEQAAERAAGVLDQIRFERDLLGRTNAEREIANNLRSAGVTLETEMGRAIALEGQLLYEARAAQNNFNNTLMAMGDIAYDAFDSLIVQQESWNDVMGNSLKLLARMALQASLLGEGPLAGAFGTASAGGAPGGLIGALFGGARAKGGPVAAGQAYLVGEHGPEYLVPNTSGVIVPNGGAGGSTKVNMTFNVDARGADPAAATRIEQALAKFKSEVPSIVVKTVKDAQSRKVL